MLWYFLVFGVGKDVWIEGWGFDEIKFKEYWFLIWVDLD